MNTWQYRAIHTAVAAVWGKPSICELRECKDAKRYEWSNKDHKYSLERKEWWQLCSKCHSEYDGKTFGAPIPWNKGLKKIRPIKNCPCGNKFNQNRPAQIYCASFCASRFNGRFPKKSHLIENNLLTPSK